MSGFKVNFSVNNQLATPSIHAAPFAQRPAAGQPGRVFIDTNNPSTGIYRDTGTIWVQIANPASEADTLQTVTDRGNTTTQDVAIGTSSPPNAPLDVHGAGIIAILQGTGSNDSFLQFNKSGNGKFKVGNVHNSGNDYFTVYNLQENSDAILVNISTNNVAIGGGTVTPTYRLDITGSLRNTGNAYFATTSGNVGIGNTSPAAKLDVTAANGEIRSTGTAASYTQYNAFITSGVNMRIGAYATNNGFLGTTTNHPFTIETNNTERARFFANGNVAIGTSTDAGYKLDVRGQTYIDVGAGTNPILRMRVNATTAFFYGDAASYLTWSANFKVDGTLIVGNGMIGGAAKTYDWNIGTFANVQTINVTAGTPSMTIGTAGANASALITMNSTSQGFLPPRMTGAQAEAIATPSAGLLVYANNGNGVTITTTGWWGYNGAAWVKLN